MTKSQFLNWIADRLVNVYHENENTDFVLKLREIAKEQEVHDKRYTFKKPDNAI